MTRKARQEIVKSVRHEDGVTWVERDGTPNRFLVFYGNVLTTFGSWLIMKGEPYATYFEMVFDEEEDRQ